MGPIISGGIQQQCSVESVVKHNIYHDIGQHVLATRGSGFSTILALRLIAAAMANPGTVYRIEDHYREGTTQFPPGPPTHQRSTKADVELARVVQRIAEQAGLGSVKVNTRALTVTAARMGATETIPVFLARDGSGVYRA